MTQRIFGIVGWKNSGKTTMTERLVAELTRRGWTISTVKHAHHGFDIDQEGADSFRHRQAGAVEVAIVSRKRWALMHELRGDSEPDLADILARLAPCDLVLVEGYKRQSHIKIEMRRLSARETVPMAPHDPQIVAIAADHPDEGATVPVFGIDAIESIADFVERAAGLRAP